MKDMEEVEDAKVEVFGPTLKDIEAGTKMPLAVVAEVAGRNMQSDFEPILERQIHHFLNGAAGIWHIGQRDIVWTRVSREGFQKGLRLEHYGRILHAKLLGEYPALVDKVKVTLITEAALPRCGYGSTTTPKVIMMTANGTLGMAIPAVTVTTPSILTRNRENIPLN